MDLKLTTLSTVTDIDKSELNVATTGVAVALSADDSKQPPLAPLKKLPSVVRAVSVHEIDVSDSETEEKRDDMFESKYQQKVYEATAVSGKKKQKKAETTAAGDTKLSVTVTTTTTTATKTAAASSSQSPRASL